MLESAPLHACPQGGFILACGGGGGGLSPECRGQLWCCNGHREVRPAFPGQGRVVLAPYSPLISSGMIPKAS